MIKKNNRIYILIGIIIFIMFLILLFNKKNSNNTSIKVDKILPTADIIDTFDIVNEKNKIPYINAKIKGIESINNQIATIYYSKGEEDKYSYKYNISNDILYLLVSIENNNNQFFGYYIDLKNEKILSKNEILKLNKKNITDIKNSINVSLQNKYSELVNADYIIEEQCDFNCFLEEHKIDLDHNLVFYVDDKFETYLNFNNKVFYLSEGDKSTIEYKY